jgi:hypothetical protein
MSLEYIGNRQGEREIKTQIRATAEEEYAVTGYVTGTLVGLENAGQTPVKFEFAPARDEQYAVCLRPGERHSVEIDVFRCIRDKFMPFVKTTEDIRLSVVWETGCSADRDDVQETRRTARVYI